MNPYAVLGVPVDADADTLRAAWRDAARRWHPDRCADPSAPRRFGEAREAFELLSDPERRAAFDRGEAPTPKAAFVGGLHGVFTRVAGREPTEREATGLRILEVVGRFGARWLRGGE